MRNRNQPLFLAFSLFQMLKLLVNRRRTYIGEDDMPFLMGADLVYRLLCLSVLFRAFIIYNNIFSELTATF